MEQGDLPVIHGADWRPQAPLEFIQQLHADTARSEVLRFVTQRHDGVLPVVVLDRRGYRPTRLRPGLTIGS